MERKERLWDLLKIDPEQVHIISAVGGGGKTSLLFALAREMRACGKTVCITTTTHMLDEVRDGFRPIGNGVKDGKLEGVSQETIDRLAKAYEVVLVEADGSKHLPLKAPGLKEPVIPEGCDLVIGVAGASAIGKMVQETSHRPEMVCRVLACGPDKIVDMKDVLTLLTSPEGQKKQVKKQYRFLINQKDVLTEEAQKELLTEIGKCGEKGILVSLHDFLCMEK